MLGNVFLRTAALAASLALAGVAHAQFRLTSPDIKPGATIADEQVFNGFGCSGKNISPALQWSGRAQRGQELRIPGARSPCADGAAPAGGIGSSSTFRHA